MSFNGLLVVRKLIKMCEVCFEFNVFFLYFNIFVVIGNDGKKNFFEV